MQDVMGRMEEGLTTVPACRAISKEISDIGKELNKGAVKEFTTMNGKVKKMISVHSWAAKSTGSAE
eukprot:8547440-Pyramimonas_sp.AAC.1